MKNKILVLLFLGVISLSACLKDNNTYVDPGKVINEQFTKDSLLMSQFIIDEDIDTSGVVYGILYQILEPGAGNHVYTQNSKITVKYKGRLLNGTVFDETTGGAERNFILGGLIRGWQIGLQKIQKGGKIRLIIPSFYGYGSTPRNGIPANSVLDFEIELTNVE